MKFLTIFLLVFNILSAQSPKKGIGLSEKKGFNHTHLKSLKVSWYYNWDLNSKVNTDLEFVPMLFSLKKIDALKSYKLLLAFNEPDHTKQANISYSQAIENWDKLVVSKVNKIGSPAIAGNLLKDSNWLDQFLISNPKCDFICVHWYRGCNPEKFISEMKNIIQKYQKPIWITEFAPQTASSSKKEPNKYTQKEVNQFITTVCDWMNSEPMVYRYAWHDSKVGTSALFDTAGKLTETGKRYSSK